MTAIGLKKSIKERVPTCNKNSANDNLVNETISSSQKFIWDAQVTWSEAYSSIIQRLLLFKIQDL